MSLIHFLGEWLYPCLLLYMIFSFGPGPQALPLLDPF